MRLIPVVETINAERRTFVYTYRPRETEADLVAAAASKGDVYGRYMVDVLDDNYHVDDDDDPTRGEAYWHAWEICWRNNLEEHGVDWDPTIRL